MLLSDMLLFFHDYNESLNFYGLFIIILDTKVVF